MFACTLDIGTAIIPYYTQIAIGTAHSLVWKSYSLFKSVDCTVTSGSKPNLTSSDSFSTLWVTSITNVFTCSFTFTNSLITSTAGLTADANKMFTIDISSWVANLAPFYIVNISSALSTDVYSYITDAAPPTTPTLISSVDYQITLVSASTS